MARTKKNRLIQMAPQFQGFSPQGVQSRKGNEVSINFEEYEALKLCDYEMLTQAEAAQTMKVSRPTFTRIYESARQKIARAFVEGSEIRFAGGNVDIARWYKCGHCQITFTLADDSQAFCPICKSNSIIQNS